ncbi:MAG: NAD-dependent epimerase/dehydratase family protein [Chloroflexota bacterium]|nr:NAD-dependent epimerase/dehydratase family protein [Chloroflexota bacterium]
MKIFVTGATGFIGGHLVRRLLNDQHEIHALIRPETDQNPLEPAIVHTHLGSTQNMIEIIQDAKPDAVIHLASLFIGEHKSSDVEALIKSNVVLSTQLAEAMSVNDVRLLINVGTSWQHYANADYNPVNLYAATKQAFRSVLSFYVETADLRVINLELYDTFGPNDQREKLFNLLNRLRVTGETISMSPGNQLLDPIYIDDVCDAFLVALKRLQSGQVKRSETYSVCSDKSIQLRELVKIYENISNTKLNVEWGGRPYRAREVMHPWPGGVTLPGWSPKVSIEEGIKIMLQSYV